MLFLHFRDNFFRISEQFNLTVSVPYVGKLQGEFCFGTKTSTAVVQQHGACAFAKSAIKCRRNSLMSYTVLMQFPTSS